ncbi:MAG: tetratricopeptide repeat protein [Ignavibacteriales bacterium]|nr:tetratricopeptide repeat protein [Ignavibacteriales bacterium]MCF8306236.1 tetratricopeptide repeat protein [Ignavibacteriales bacterium]MCF8315957.1 tetratricopeptide repeat protein [Ignavibacteriales bacterium]MCF8437551.1 tetratricopeptide repeat protein [Ignavibacteriales bacterium]
MSEMLGNQLFMIRNYSEAEKIFEEILNRYPQNKQVRKKLIICYTQTGKISRAFELFLSLISEDINIILNTNPVEDDCPCPELVYDTEHLTNEDDPEANLRLGILYLYCDATYSVKYFEKSLKSGYMSDRVKSALLLIKNHLNQKREKSREGRKFGYPV